MAVQRTLPKKFKRQLLTVANVAQLLGISQSLVYAMCEADPPEIGFLRFGRPGRRGTYRFLPLEVTQLAERKYQGSAFDAHVFAEGIRSELED